MITTVRIDGHIDSTNLVNRELKGIVGITSGFHQKFMTIIPLRDPA